MSRNNLIAFDVEPRPYIGYLIGTIFAEAFRLSDSCNDRLLELIRIHSFIDDTIVGYSIVPTTHVLYII